MTATAATLSTEWPTTVFHADGVRDRLIPNQTEMDRAMAEGCWYERPQEPPPLPPPPMTPEESLAQAQSELEGLGDQVDAQAQVITNLGERISELAESQDANSTVVNGILTMQQEIQNRQTKLDGRQAQVAEIMGGILDRVKVLEDALANSAAAFGQIDGRLTALEIKKKGAQANGSTSTDSARG